MDLLNRLKNLSEADIKLVLDSEADSVEEGTYVRELTPEELLAYKELFAEKSMQQAQILDELKSIKDEFKEKLKPIAKEISGALQAIKFKAVECVGRQYKVADHEGQMIYTIDQKGDVINSRRMKPEERQYFLKPAKSA